VEPESTRKTKVTVKKSTTEKPVSVKAVYQITGLEDIPTEQVVLVLVLQLGLVTMVSHQKTILHVLAAVAVATAAEAPPHKKREPKRI